MKIKNFSHPNPSLRVLLTLGAILCFPAISSAQGLDAGVYADGVGGGHHRLRHRGPRGERGPRMSPEQRVERRLARMTQELSLTPNQARRIRSILSQTASQMQRLRPERPNADQGRARAERREGRRAFREQTRALRWETQDRVHAVLSCEQRETLRRAQRQRRLELRESRQERRGERRSRRQRGDGPMRGGR